MQPSQSTGDKLSRRRFNKATAAAAAGIFGFHYLPASARGNLERLAVAGIGIGGKGRSDIQGAEQAGMHVAALVDPVDTSKMNPLPDERFRSIAEARETYSGAAFYTDYREMIADLGDKIDAVTIGAPDHHHFHASHAAMRAGKHVYCQKPLTHGIWEARELARVAQASGVKTQMGNQAHAQDHMRRCVELIRAGIIGKVKEVHAWTNRPGWAQGFRAPPPEQPAPAGLDWEQWIGPAPSVGYSPRIAPFSWRGWWSFGTGALGDMACHIMDMGYWAMQPATVRSVVASQSGGTDLSPPISSHVTWDFAPNELSSPDGFQYHWYDGYVDARFDAQEWRLIKASKDFHHPDADVLEGLSHHEFTCVVVGEDGKLFFNGGKNEWVVKPSVKLDGFKWPAPSIPRAAQQNPYLEWGDAIHGRIDQAESHFGHSGPFTETVLLGTLAQRFPEERLEWDSEKLQVRGRPELSILIQREYRPGWEVDA